MLKKNKVQGKMFRYVKYCHYTVNHFVFTEFYIYEKSVFHLILCM